jgi:hypothetical protein
MWIYNKDFKKWEIKQDVLLLDDFQYLSQELESFRFYSKCLSGATYLPINNTEDIYDIVSISKPKTWYISTIGSQYSNTSIPQNFPTPIDTTTSYNFYTKSLSEYGTTLKNLFTPDKIIRDSINNFIYVDVATNTDILDINETIFNREVDGVRLVEGHRVLVKDQKSRIILPISINPDTYFKGDYVIIQNTGTDVEYEFFNEINGIYVYRNGLLIREPDLDDYEKCIRFSVSVKLGDVNREKQFHLSRLTDGYYPTTSLNEPIRFLEKKNWILRNRVDYNNLFDINYYDVYRHGTQSYSYDGVTYSIPERTISIGEFGNIINNQSGVSNVIRNKYKINLRNISETSIYYWIVGDAGTLLRVRKHDFDINRIEVDCKCPIKIVTTDLKSISFFNDLNGVAVGDLNTILITEDGGFTWNRHIIEAFNAYYFNKVIYKDINNFYIAGNNGVFIQFKREFSGWVAYKRRISKFIDDEDEFLLVDNINDMISTNLDNWGLTYSFSTQSISPTKDILMLVTDSGNIIVHDIDDSIPFYTDFIYLEFENNNYGDIQSIFRQGSTNNFFFTGFSQTQSGIFSFNISNFVFLGTGNEYSNVISTTFSTMNVSSFYPNSMYDYNGQFLISGNNSLLKSGDYLSFSFSDLDQTFESKLKSKLLFLDYDVASKLNFFTDDGDYRLPNSVEFPINNILGAFIGFDTLTQSEVNWWKYWQDSNMTFQYYSTSNVMTDNTKVVPSATFSYSNVNQLTITSITNSAVQMASLAPTILDPSHSRFNGIGLTAPSLPTSNHQVYLYDYLMVIRFTPNSLSVSNGDIIRIESDVVNENFMVNKVVSINQFNSLAYVFTEFNEGIISDLISNTGSIIIKNLNRFNSLQQLNDRFNLHPISNGYQLITKTQSNIVTINAKFNNITSYYNLATKVNTNQNQSFTMSYQDSFMKFGYTPTYNILDYLEYIDSNNFNSSKEYLAMPVYLGIPMGSVGLSSNNAYIDYNYPDNKIKFGEDLKFEWESILLNTFVDVIIYNNNQQSYTNERLLVLDKYKVNNYEGLGFDAYFIEFHKSLNVGNSTLSSLDIISRRSLLQISQDLQLLNNIQRPYKSVRYLAGSSQQQWNVDFLTFDKYLNFKPNTDSYVKILLSDFITVDSLSGVIYTDYKNELSLNITRLEKEESIPIFNTGDINGSLLITCTQVHELETGDGVVLEFNGGVGSSQLLNQQYFGYHVVNIVSPNSFYIDIPFGTQTTVGNDTGFVKYVRRDPFLNYQPVDIIDLGTNKIGKIAVELSPDNTILSENKYRLSGIDFTKYRFRLVDSLNVEILATSYSWIYEAEISDAVIGLDSNGIVWYKGIWECGRWFGGTWISGSWISGDWYKGLWKSKLIKDNWINVEVDENYTDFNQSIWFTGRWFGGDWENGTWIRGRWYDGVWNNGIWYDGIWNDGIWQNGQFTGGIWVLGDWNGGVFGAKNGPAYWLDGSWYGGDFENGIWFNGTFDSKNSESRFGVKSYNSRASIWHAGKWINGSFHSRLNIDDNGNYDVSDIHKYSVWYTGQWFNGNFYGGVAFNIDFKSGTWHGGILEDIKVIGLSGSNTTSENYFTINGIYKFNIGDEISIIDNQLSGTYSQYGSNLSPGNYKVLYTIEDNINNRTNVYIDRIINNNVNAPSDVGIRVVSRFKNCNWKSGIWFNGIYEQGLWEGGIWYNGVFNATWT